MVLTISHWYQSLELIFCMQYLCSHIPSIIITILMHGFLLLLDGLSFIMYMVLIKLKIACNDFSKIKSATTSRL